MGGKRRHWQGFNFFCGVAEENWTIKFRYANYLFRISLKIKEEKDEKTDIIIASWMELEKLF